MTQELSLMELITGASTVVQGVMLILVLASLASWFLIVQRVMLMRRTDDELLVFEERFWSGIDLAQLYREGNQAVADGQLPTGVESLFRAGFKEFSRLSQQADMDADAILEGSRRAMRVALMRETDRIEQHLPFLASVGSTSHHHARVELVRRGSLLEKFQSHSTAATDVVSEEATESAVLLGAGLNILDVLGVLILLYVNNFVRQRMLMLVVYSTCGVLASAHRVHTSTHTL